jgi:hypothetical protein
MTPGSRSRPRKFYAALFTFVVLLGVVASATTVFADETQFKADLDALTASPHRLAGTEQGRAAGDYILQRLEAIGVEQALSLEFPMWQTAVERCELVIDGQTVQLHPLRPNLLANPVTPSDGIEAPMLYVGKGTIADIAAALTEHREALGGATSVEGMILVFDYDSFDHWDIAFSLGARAVIFLGEAGATNPAPLHTGAPARQVRLYAPTDAEGKVNGVDLRRPRGSVRLTSTVRWQRTVGRNIIGLIRGTDADFGTVQPQSEVMVLSAAYDSFGNVPQQSPGARNAANVAALLETAATIRADPPRRDVALVFLDNQARAHQGAREFYDALTMTAAAHEKLIRSHTEEREYLENARAMMAKRGFDLIPREGDDAATRSALDAVRRLFKDEADWARADVQAAMQMERMTQRVEDRQRRGKVPEEVEARRSAREAEGLNAMRQWDDIRRALHEDALVDLLKEVDAAAAGQMPPDNAFRSKSLLRAFERGQQREAGAEAVTAEAKRFRREVLDELLRLTEERVRQRLGELAIRQAIDAQRTALREVMWSPPQPDADPQPNWVTLHATYDFGDAAATWGPVLGEWTPQLFPVKGVQSGADDPGFYVRLLSALREVVGDEAEALGIEPQTLRDTGFGWTFAPGRFVHGGTIAGQHGIYNLALMTGYDTRQRDGHPADTTDALQWRRLRDQAVAAADVMRRFADSPNQSQPRRFSTTAQSKRISWESNKPKGEYAGLRITGGLSERRPAAGALLTIYPGAAGRQGNALDILRQAEVIPAFEPVIHEIVNANGNYRITNVRKDKYSEPILIGALYEDDGTIHAISSLDTINNKLSDAMRTDLFLAKPRTFSFRSSYQTKPELLRVLRANADSVFRPNRHLFGQVGDHNVFFIAEQVIDDRVKLFQAMGPVALGELTEDQPSGTGLDAMRFVDPPWLTEVAAEDLWQINESRLRRLRARGVTSADLELLHSRAGRTLERARTTEDLAARESGLSRSHMLSHRVYTPLRLAMDDLVHSVVMLLLLAIPFAFSLERLIIGATSIYGRIAGFVVMFLVTFALLYWLHPGFAIASTPIIIFLAFAIILLSSLVIYIVARKFRTELRAMQGQGGGAHELEVSKTGAMLAAVGMGISTMRRRPTRTLLTAITVVMLTFTILCFASFSTMIGVRSVYEGPLGEGMPESVMLRNLDYSAMPAAVTDLLAGEEGEGGLLAEQWWAVPTPDQTQVTSFSITRPEEGRSEKVNAVMGLDRRELARWPELAAVLDGSRPGQAGTEQNASAQPVLGDDDIYLPRIVANLLDLKVGDTVLVQGVEATYRGMIDGEALQRLRHIDGEPALPVDFQDEANAQAEGAGGGATGAAEDEMALASDVQRDFVYLSADQVALASNQLVRRIDGDLHILTLYPGQDITPTQKGADLAKVVVMPVWAAGAQGVERLILTRLTEVAGGMRLFVPLLLGGLIIFGTLLGSISDREREIYTFSALGLSPGHVGVLFFAEATVYAVVGGMGGQLLAQMVALAATQLTKAGIIDPISINYSSTNSLFAIAVVMATVIISAIYPAYRASKSANPGLARSWKMPKPEEDELKLVFPFTVSAYDITGIVSFLAEHFRRHDDAGLGDFAANDTKIRRDEHGELQLAADLALAPFDLGVTQHLTLTAVPSEIPGVDEIAIHAHRLSGAKGDWIRSNRVFLRGIRRQFLLWRTLGADVIEQYRMETLQELGEAQSDAFEHTQPQDEAGGESGVRDA